jgi:hypothetical protein
MSQISRRDAMRTGLSAAAVGVGAKFALSAPAYADVLPKRRRHHHRTSRTGTRFAGDPGTGQMYYGCNVDGGNPLAFEKTVGATVGVYRSYWQPSQTSQMVSVAARDHAAGRLPFMSTKLPSTWADVASGSQDAWLYGMISSLAALSGPVWLCLHHEPYDDQGPGQSANDFKAMCARAFARTSQTSNISFVPIMQSSPFNRTVYGTHNLSEWIDPASCDIVGLDSYNHWYAPSGNNWKTPTEVFSVCDQAAAMGRTIAIAEYGVRTDPTNTSKAAVWMRRAHDLLVARGDVVAMSYFNSAQNVNDGGTPWTLDGNRLTAFKNILPTTARMV